MIILLKMNKTQVTEKGPIAYMCQASKHDKTEKNDRFKHAHEDDGPVDDKVDGGYSVGHSLMAYC